MRKDTKKNPDFQIFRSLFCAFSSHSCRLFEALFPRFPHPVFLASCSAVVRCFSAAFPALFCSFLALFLLFSCSFPVLFLLLSRCLSCCFLAACLALSHCLSCSFPAACPALALMFDPCFSASFLSFSVHRSSFFVPYFPVSCRFFLFFHGFSSFSHGFLLFFRRQFLLFPSTFPPCYSLFLLFFPLPLLPFSRPRSPSTGFALFSGAFSSGLPVRRCLLSGAYDSCCCTLPFLMGNV